MHEINKKNIKTPVLELNNDLKAIKQFGIIFNFKNYIYINAWGLKIIIFRVVWILYKN